MATMTVPDVDLNKVAMLGNRLLGQLDALRAADPIHWSPASNAWIVTDHAAVAEGFSGKLPLSVRRHELVAGLFPNPEDRARRINYILEIFPHMLSIKDHPEHLRLRTLLMGAFSRQRAEDHRPAARRIVAEVLDGVADLDLCDFIEDIARPITTRMILRVMGLPATLLPQMKRWSIVMNEGLNGSMDRDQIAAANDAMFEARTAFLAEIDKRRAAPGDDFVSNLMTARIGDDALTDTELVAQLILVINAGHDTTLNTMALVIAELARDGAAREHMRAHPEQVEACIMEMMRVVAMSTSMMRLVAEDFVWNGKQLRKGQAVYLMIASANRDEKVFPDPERIDFARSQLKNMTFAPGQHFCIGHWFAKMMMSEFFPAFLDRYASWTLLDDEIAFSNSAGFRQVKRLNLRLA